MEDTKTGSDQREYLRAPIELRVEYRRLNTFFADYTKNISQGGTFIKTTKPLDIGTDFVFKLLIPTLEEPITIVGRVQWVVQPGEEKPGESPGMGIKFIYDNDEQRALVQNKVERLMIDSLGRHLFNRLVSPQD